MANESYVCVELVNGVCQSWAVHTSILDSLAITPVQAGKISTAIILVLVTGWVLGELGRLIKNSNNPFG
ncbi:hypothetical protein GCM10009129_23420 [Psychrobacter aestuarii]|uniref:Uncharacterized protein n=1 Tax=Psychrobacter aestuarii TaxID=556327 RepID=A0ABP3FV91_9GAMM